MPPDSTEPQRRLSLVDCTSIIVGIIIGSGIYESTPLVAGQMAAAWQLPAIWVVGGLFALVGSICYAEMATRLPKEGGDYVYLSEGLGRGWGFLFAWTQLWVIRPGSIGAMACVFAVFAGQLLPLGRYSFLLYACGSTVVLTLINVLGVRVGTWTQNALTAAKLLGLAGIVIAGFAVPSSDAAAGPPPTTTSWAFAMIFILFAYGGWNEMGCVAAEVREPRRNILRALLLGTVIITAIYTAVNVACYHALGLSGMADRGPSSPPMAADVVTRAVGDWGSAAISVLICLSALGSLNGMIFTGARIYYALGKRHRAFAPLAVWSRQLDTPISSLLLQGIVTAALTLGFATIGEGDEHEAFKRLVYFMAPPYFLFLILSAAAVVTLRLRRAGDDSGAFRMPLFPLPVVALAAASLFMLYQSTTYAWSQLNAGSWWVAAWVVGTLVSGVAIAFFDRGENRKSS